MTDLSFWAQSLDNQSPDIIFQNGQELSDDELRRKLVSEIYEVPRNNVEVSPTDSSIAIRYSHTKFVIEAIPEEKDQANRLAPVIIYGELPDEWDNWNGQWAKEVCHEIKKFVSIELRRTLDSGVLRDIEDGLDKIAKKKRANLQSNPLNLLKNVWFGLAKWLKMIVKISKASFISSSSEKTPQEPIKK